MARPISWLPRLHEIRKSVTNSVRSHYTRSELEDLFQLQPRMASRYLGSLPTVKVGTAYMVKREDLLAFLNEVNEADDPHEALSRTREEKAGVSRRALRNLVRHDIEPASLASLTSDVTLDMGRLEIRFASAYQLVESLWAIASILQGDGLDEFVQRYEPKPEVVEDQAATDMKALWAELEEMQAARAAFAQASGADEIAEVTK